MIRRITDRHGMRSRGSYGYRRCLPLMMHHIVRLGFVGAGREVCDLRDDYQAEKNAQ